MLDDELTTDAIPSPPRNRKNYSPNDKRKPEASEPESDEEKVKAFKNAQPPINQAVVYITGSTNVQVGHNFHFGTGKVNSSKKSEVVETEKIISLKNSKEAVVPKDIDLVAQHMCSGWEATAHALGYSDGEIYKFEYKNHKDIKQTLHNLLTDWIEYKGLYIATVGTLARTLWDKEQKETVKLWSEEYDKIHH